MKTFALITLLLVSLVNVAQAKPYKRALILPAGGFIAAAHLATYHAASRAGLPADLVIGTCGGGLAAAIIEKFPDYPKKQLEFLTSRKVHKKLLEISRTKYAGTLHLLKMFATAKKLGRQQAFSQKYLFDVPQDLELFETAGFVPKSETKSFATILQSTEFIPQIGSKKDFTQVYLTDTETAKYLQDQKSYVAQMYPESHITENTKVVTDFNLNEATRASFPDPYMMPPFLKDSKVYMTGAVDGLPLELANQLADETLYFFKNDIPGPANNVFRKVFGYSFMGKIENQRDNSVEYMTDEHINADISIDPTFSLFKGMKNNIPTSYEKYKEITMNQYYAATYYVNEVMKSRGLVKEVPLPMR